MNDSDNSVLNISTNNSINWTSTLSGRIKIVSTSNNCTNGASSGTMTLVLNSVGNTLDSQAAQGTNTWVGHVYKWRGEVSTITPSPTTPLATKPFTGSEYVGYYTQTENFVEGFGGKNVCFPVYSNGVVRTNINTDQFAVRYKMKSTRAAGCYLVSVTGNDGVRLYINNDRVFNEWQSQTVSSFTKCIGLFGWR